MIPYLCPPAGSVKPSWSQAKAFSSAVVINTLSISECVCGEHKAAWGLHPNIQTEDLDAGCFEMAPSIVAASQESFSGGSGLIDGPQYDIGSSRSMEKDP